MLHYAAVLKKALIMPSMGTVMIAGISKNTCGFQTVSAKNGLIWFKHGGHFGMRIISYNCLHFLINVLVYQFRCYYHKMHIKLDCG